MNNKLYNYEFFRIVILFCVFLTSSLRYKYPQYYALLDFLFVLSVAGLETISEKIGRLKDGRDNH